MLSIHSFFSGAFTLLASGASSLPFPMVVPVVFINSFFSGAFTLLASGASSLPFSLVVPVMFTNSFFSGAFTASGAHYLSHCWCQ